MYEMRVCLSPEFKKKRGKKRHNFEIGRNLQMNFLHARLAHKENLSRLSTAEWSYPYSSCPSPPAQTAEISIFPSATSPADWTFFSPLWCVDLLLGFQLEQSDIAKRVLERNRAGWGGRDTFPAAESQSAPFYGFIRWFQTFSHLTLATQPHLILPRKRCCPLTNSLIQSFSPVTSSFTLAKLLYARMLKSALMRPGMKWCNLCRDWFIPS